MKALTKLILVAFAAMTVSAKAKAGTYTLRCDSLVYVNLATPSWGDPYHILNGELQSMGYKIVRTSDGRGADYHSVSATYTAPNPDIALSYALNGLCRVQRDNLSATLQSISNKINIFLGLPATAPAKVLKGVRYQTAYVYEGSTLSRITSSMPLNASEF